jgi:hypothetical protein
VDDDRDDDGDEVGYCDGNDYRGFVKGGDVGDETAVREFS